MDRSSHEKSAHSTLSAYDEMTISAPHGKPACHLAGFGTVPLRLGTFARWNVLLNELYSPFKAHNGYSSCGALVVWRFLRQEYVRSSCV
jgi:hypothetical protein